MILKALSHMFKFLDFSFTYQFFFKGVWIYPQFFQAPDSSIFFLPRLHYKRLWLPKPCYLWCSINLLKNAVSPYKIQFWRLLFFLLKLHQNSSRHLNNYWCWKLFIKHFKRFYILYISSNTWNCLMFIITFISEIT